ncbi:MAG: S8 family serine peptidase [Clostridia bacterium]|nr:S8 family serine peptidase [Clostridia bacterium]
MENKYYVYLDSGICCAYHGIYLTDKVIRNNYVINEKRRIVSALHTEYNKNFCREHQINPIFLSRYCDCIIVGADDKKVDNLKKDNRVKSIIPFTNKVPIIHQTDIISRQIKSDSINGSHAPGFDGTRNGYLGNSVTVGAVSAQNLTYIPTSYQLKEPIRQGKLFTLTNGEVEFKESVHSSVVAGILVGSTAEYGGETYRGIVPESVLYIAPSFSVISMFEAVENCLDRGAQVINYSAGEFEADGNYDEFDRYIDTLIYNIGFLFVSSAGNSEYVSSPAMCFNGISVGNVQTKSNSVQGKNPPYPMFFVSEDDCSAYIQDDNLPNKPDVAAPGTFIHYVDSEGDFDFARYGTSFSAPYVTGTAAQIIQKNPDVKIYPALLKAILLCGADSMAISTENNNTIGKNNILRKKSGAGFIDSASSLTINDYYNGEFLRNSELIQTSISIELSKGERIRTVLCYLKTPGDLSENSEDAILEFYLPSGRLVLSSDDKKENVKIFEYTAEQTGVYTISVKAADFGTSDRITYGVAYKKY